MERKRRVKYEGREVVAEEIGFAADGPESWTVYNLADGSRLKLKTVLLDVIRLEGEYSESGDPIYLFTAHQVVGVQADESLKKK